MLAFGIGVLLSLAISAIVVYVLRQRLYDVLTDICGTEYRAKFWLTFTHTMLFLTPLLAVLLFGIPTEPPEGIEFSLSVPFLRQLLAAILAGVFVALIGIAWQITRPLKMLPSRRESASGDSGEFWGDKQQ